MNLIINFSSSLLSESIFFICFSNLTLSDEKSSKIFEPVLNVFEKLAHSFSRTFFMKLKLSDNSG